MRLDITTCTPAGRSWFTAGEAVSGNVVWMNTSPAIVNRIDVYLEGILETAIKPVISGQQSAFGTARRIVFTESKALYPPCTSLAKRHSTFAPGHHTFHYTLALPHKDRELSDPKLEASLPPNFTFTADGIKVCMSYRISVVVERKGLLKPNLTKAQAIEFRPLMPFYRALDPRNWDSTSRTAVCVDGRNTQGMNNVLKASSFPPVTLEVSLHGPKTLRPGNPISLSISFIIPIELQHSFMPTWIFGISIRLKARTVAVAAGNTRAHTGYVDICNFQAVLPVAMQETESRVVLPSLLWEHCIYPAAIPTFYFADTKRSYQLEINVDFADRKAVEVHKATTLIDVKFECGVIASPDIPHEPPPEYSLDVR